MKKPQRKRGYRKKGLKLKKQTVYSLFGFGFILTGIFCLLSYTASGSSLVALNTILKNKFGASAIFFPFLLIFFGFFMFHIKNFLLSRATIALGYVVFFVSFIGMTKSGEIGTGLFQILQEILTPAGADAVFIAGVLVGVIVFFDTSIDEIVQGVNAVGHTGHRLIPTSLFHREPKPEKALELDRNRPITIKGGMPKENALAVAAAKADAPMTQKKDPELISQKLVTNVLGSNGGIWEYPPLSLLSDNPGKKAERGDINKVASLIEKTLQSFGIEARVAEVNLGPAVTQYALEIALGTKVSKITSLANDLALATEAPTGQIRIEAPIPGRNLVGIEIPNRSLELVTLRTMLSSTVMQKSKSKLTVSMGLDVSGNPITADIAKMPHVLVAGTTGSGKSSLINSFVCSLLFRASPSEVKLILVDPKRVEFTSYNGIPHLLTPVIVEPEKILSALKWAMGEMDRRYKLFAERGVRNIEGYNELSGFQALPYIVIIIDELADLMMFAPVEVEDAIARLAQMARATGIHLVIATQRPSVNVITGLIKANIPTRIAFNVTSIIDSRVIIDTPGAEKLLGRGDMLYVPPDQSKPSRIQGAFVGEKEIKDLVEYLKSKNVPVEYTEEIINQPLPLKKGAGGGSSDGLDPMFEDVVRLVCQYDTASASFIQRKLSVGYARAARILDQLEEKGIVGHAEGAKPREVLVRNAEDYLTEMQSAQP